MIQHRHGSQDNYSKPQEMRKSISKREREILKLVADGFSKKQIADKLNISPFTVAAHVRKVYEKLEVPNAPAAVSRSYQLGILQLNLLEVS